jgi:hypothetical protein
MSGGPTVDSQGRVVGVNSFGIVGEPQAFNFIRPASAVASLLADKGVKNQVGGINSTYRKGVQAYFAGDRDTALKDFNQVLEAVPSHALAQEYRRKALLLPKASSGLSTVVLAGIVAGGVLLLVLLAAGLLLWRRRGGAAAAAPAPSPAPAPAPAAERSVAPEPPAYSGAATTRAAAPNGGGGFLVLRDGPDAGHRFRIDAPLLLGREHADVPIDDPEVSRRHAIVRSVDGGVEVSDVGSANGTSVNGVRIREDRRLANGDVITVGKTSLAVELPTRGAATVVARRP